MDSLQTHALKDFAALFQERPATNPHRMRSLAFGQRLFQDRCFTGEYCGPAQAHGCAIGHPPDKFFGSHLPEVVFQ